MLKIRLQRVGRKNDPSYRVVVVDSRQGPKSGKQIDQVGFYNPVAKVRTIDKDKAKHWLGVGAQASGTVYNLLVTEGVLTGKKINVLPKKRPPVKEETPVAEQIQSSKAPEVAPAETEAASTEADASQEVLEPQEVGETAEESEKAAE